MAISSATSGAAVLERPSVKTRKSIKKTSANHNEAAYENHVGQPAANGKSQAVAEFSADGTVLEANEKFLAVMGYTLDEVKGRNHSMFVEEWYRTSPEYLASWERLRQGEFVSKEFKCIAKSGREVWIQASYNPIFDSKGRVFKVVKFATDVTERTVADAESASQLEAIRKSFAVIEFTPDGTVVDANENFLTTIGYSLNEIKGRHHSMFVDPAERSSAEYTQFWAALGRGEVQHGAHKRFGKGGREVWVRSSYMPTLDEYGKVMKVVELALDITESKQSHLTMMSTVTSSATALSSSVEEFTALSGEMARSAGKTAADAQAASAASEQISRSVGSVAAASEQMQASIREIARNANDSARVAKNAVTVANSANQTVVKLGESSQEIGDVIKVITSIAQQTNLLALNATIEAARAGEAGKGFAVVANEVKELAKQTAKATEDIGRKIEAIRNDTNSAVKAIGEIGEIIGQVNDISNSIASAVEEQTVTTNDISRNVMEAAKGIEDVAQSIAGVAQAARNTTGGTTEMQKASLELSRMASEMESVIRSTSI